MTSRAPWTRKPPPRRHNLLWTAGEDEALLAATTREARADLARRLGRTAKAAEGRYWKLRRLGRLEARA